jgi:hypothetical protein
MRPLRARFTVRGLMGLVAVLAIAMALGTARVSDQYSCHLCHNRKEVDSRTILWLPIWWRERIVTGFPFSNEHHHEWFCYSSTHRGILGGTGRFCRAMSYADGSAAPDGLK